MSELASLVDRLEALRQYALHRRETATFDWAVRVWDDHLATLDDAIEALHPVHGEGCV